MAKARGINIGAEEKDGRVRSRGPGARRKPKSPIALPNERTINETDKTIPVAPKKRGGGGPTPEGPAIDRRKQFAGSGDRKGKG